MGKINVGDWVTQYKAGYWMVKELHAKCSLFDSGGLHKGDPAGFIAVLQKALGSRFNFDMEMSACDLSLCSPVTKAEKRKIDKYYYGHPDEKTKFETYEATVPPSVTAIRLSIDEQQRARLSALLDIELPCLTYQKVEALLAENGIAEAPAGADNALLYLYGYVWEHDANFNQVYFNYEIKLYG